MWACSPSAFSRLPHSTRTTVRHLPPPLSVREWTPARSPRGTGRGPTAAGSRSGDVRIVPQNVDDLHERAGSSRVLHLHGEIRKARSTQDPTLVTQLGDGDIQLGDRCELGSQLRPHIGWIGESVPAMREAGELVRQADVLLVVGGSHLDDIE